MEERVGFEPTEHHCSTVFKTVAINLTLPPLRMAKAEGIEPTSIVLETTVLPLNYALLGRCLTNHNYKVYYSTLQLFSFQ